MKSKKKIEFSKLLVIFVITILTLIGIWSIVEYYILVKLAIETNSSVLPDCTLPVTCITTILGAILTYCLYQGALKTSLNKNKLSIDNVTGIISSITENNLLDAVEKTFSEDEDANE